MPLIMLTPYRVSSGSGSYGDILKSSPLIIPASNVNSNLTDFVVRIDLSDMPDDWWSAVNPTGTNIRVRTLSQTLLSIDLVDVDVSGQTGLMFFKSDLDSSVDNVFTVDVYDVAPVLSPTDDIGRNSVWADYTAVFMFASLNDRTGNGYNASIEGSVSTYNYTPTAVGSDVASHQGLAYDGTYFYVIDTTSIQKYDASWTPVGAPFLLSSISTPDVNHFGDGCIHSGNLYVVYEKYPNSSYDNQHVAVIDPSTMTLSTTYDISAQEHEVSSITYDTTNGYFVVTDYTSAGTSLLHKYDPSDFSYLGSIATEPIVNKQGITYYDGYFWITCLGKTLYKLSLDGSTISVEWNGTVSGDMEGIAAKGDGDLFILFDGTPSAVYTFSPTDGSELPGWLTLTGTGNARADGLPQLTQWTMGASIIANNLTNNNSILSYSGISTVNTNRASLVLRSTGQFGIWNSTDSWLMSTASAPTLASRHRVHHTQNATTDRKIWVDGAIAATDSGCVQRPSTSSPSLYVGAEDADHDERLDGAVNYVYLRNGVLSEDWLAAEYLSWETPNSFYSIWEPVAEPAPDEALVTEYNSADEYVHDWADLSGWTTANVQVASNRLYGVNGTNPSAAFYPFEVGPTESARLTCEIVRVTGVDRTVYVGFDAVGGVPASLPNFCGIGVDGGDDFQYFVGSNFTGVTTGAHDLVARSGGGTFRVTVTADPDYISLVVRAADSSEEASHVIPRSSLPGDGTIAGITFWNTDQRGTSGSYVKGIGVRKSLTPFQTKTTTGAIIEGNSGQVIHRGTSGDMWRIQLPRDMDGETAHPICLFTHQASTGDRNSVWDETRARPLLEALDVAGYIVISADDNGDRWGNDDSVTNYAAAVQWVRDNFYAGPVVLWSPSMGGAPGFNLILRRELHVRAIAALCPVCDLSEMYSGYSSSLNAAYSVSDLPGLETAIVGYNPIDGNMIEFTGKGVRFRVAASGDTIVPEDDHAVPMKAALEAYAVESDLIEIASGHLQPEHYDPSDLVAFFNRHTFS